MENEDHKDIVFAAARQLSLEIQKLAAAANEFNDNLKDQDTAEEVLYGMVKLMAQQTSATIAISTTVLSHLNAEGYMKKEIKLHS